MPRSPPRFIVKKHAQPPQQLPNKLLAQLIAHPQEPLTRREQYIYDLKREILKEGLSETQASIAPIQIQNPTKPQVYKIPASYVQRIKDAVTPLKSQMILHPQPEEAPPKQRPKTVKPYQSNYLEQLQLIIEQAIRESDTNNVLCLNYSQFQTCYGKLGFQEHDDFSKLLYALLIGDQTELSCAIMYDAMIVLMYNARRADLAASFKEYIATLYNQDADTICADLVQTSCDELCSLWRRVVKAKKNPVKPRPMTSQQLQEERELQECTFKPEIHQVKNRFDHTIITASSIGKATPYSTAPKAFEKQVNRIRDAHKQRENLQLLMEKKLKGEQFDKLKLARAQPPHFHTNSKRKLLLYVNVNITPQKQGRIGIYEGDDLKQLAINFCKTFNLNKTMQQMLEENLRQSYHQYLQDQGLEDRLPSDLGYSCDLAEVSVDQGLMTQEVMNEVQKYYNQISTGMTQEFDITVGLKQLQEIDLADYEF